MAPVQYFVFEYSDHCMHGDGGWPPCVGLRDGGRVRACACLLMAAVVCVRVRRRGFRLVSVSVHLSCEYLAPSPLVASRPELSQLLSPNLVERSSSACTDWRALEQPWLPLLAHLYSRICQCLTRRAVLSSPVLSPFTLAVTATVAFLTIPPASACLKRVLVCQFLLFHLSICQTFHIFCNSKRMHPWLAEAA